MIRNISINYRNFIIIRNFKLDLWYREDDIINMIILIKCTLKIMLYKLIIEYKIIYFKSQ